MTYVLYDQKWQKLLRRSRWFRYLPFVDFVLVAGSMALGDVHKQSDFDVIVGARSGRLYTARFFCLAFYAFLGWRRSAQRTNDGFCFNHFVTEPAYHLNPPYNMYWQELYKNLVPVSGALKTIHQFFQANEVWTGARKTAPTIVYDLRYRYPQPRTITALFEWGLQGGLGDWLERYVRRFQVRNIETFLQQMPPGYKPRLRYTNEEVELHLDTYRLETIKNRSYS